MRKFIIFSTILIILLFVNQNLQAQLNLRIQDIQSDTAGQYTGQDVRIHGIVTSSTGTIGTGFYIQDSTGAYSGILVYTSYYNVDLGDSLVVTGTVVEYYGKTEISYPSDVTVLSTGVQVPAPTIVTTSQLATSNPDTAEMFEGVLVGILDPVVTDTSLGYGEWEIDDGTGPCRVDDEGNYTMPALYDTLCAIVGIVDYSFDNFKLQPRGDQDIYYSFSGAGTATVNPSTLIERETVSISLNLSTSFGSINQIRISLPHSLNYTGYYSLSGSGFLNATAIINADTIEISNADITSLTSGTLVLSTITPAYAGIETLFVETATAQDTFSPISSQPILQITRSDGTIPISLVSLNNLQGIPIMLDENVTITGIMTAAGEIGSKYFLQDNSAGVCVYNPGGGIAIGDSVIFQGTVDQWSGLTEISPVSLTGGPFTGTLVQPEIVTCSILELEGINGIENYEGELVRIDNLLQSVPVFPQIENNMPITDGTGNFELRVEVAEIAGKPVPPDGFSITGVISQYCPDPPYTTGYQIMPRGLFDIRKGGAGSGFAQSYLSSIPAGSSGDIRIKLISEIDTIDRLSITISDTAWHWTGNTIDVVLPASAVLDSVAGNGINLKYKIFISNLNLSPDSSCFIGVENIRAPDTTGVMTLTTETGISSDNTMSEIYNSPRIWSVYSISEVQHPDSGGFNSILEGDKVIVSGVVTGPSEIFNGGTTKTSFWIEDSTGGVNIFSSQDDGNKSFILGAEVVVRGTVTEYNGITEVVYSEVDSVTIMGYDRPLPDTLVLAENQGLYEMIEGRLAIIEKAVVTTSPVQSGSGSDFSVRNGRTLITVRLSDNSFDISEIYKGNTIDIIGIIGQYSYDIPASSGYQLLPRFNSDMTKISLGTPSDEPEIIVYPNPVAFSIGEISHFYINTPLSGRISLKIYDMEGREVMTLLENTPGGPQYITWDGLTTYGENARIGVYIVHLSYQAGDGNEKIVNKPLVVGTTLE